MRLRKSDVYPAGKEGKESRKGEQENESRKGEQESRKAGEQRPAAEDAALGTGINNFPYITWK
jgi:hypothetical protein